VQYVLVNDTQNNYGVSFATRELTRCTPIQLDFYTMADACLFRRFPFKKYGANYEDDNAKNPQGECRKEIALVKGRVYNEVQGSIRKTIDMWRGHEAVMGNDATLMVLGYGRFFALGEKCNNWSFSVLWSTQPQKVLMEMRKEFNDIVCTKTPPSHGATHLHTYFPF
jgi:hypothetical protein